MPDWALALCEGLVAQAYALAGAEMPVYYIKEEEGPTWGWASGAVPLPATCGSAAATAMKYPPRGTEGFSLQQNLIPRCSWQLCIWQDEEHCSLIICKTINYGLLNTGMKPIVMLSS